MRTRALRVGLLRGALLAVPLGAVGAIGGPSAALAWALVGFTACPMMVVEVAAASRVQAGAWSRWRAAVTLFLTAAAWLTVAWLHGLAGPLDGRPFHESIARALKTLRRDVELVVLGGLGVVFAAAVSTLVSGPARGKDERVTWGEVELAPGGPYPDAALAIERALMTVAGGAIAANAVGLAALHGLSQRGPPSAPVLALVTLAAQVVGGLTLGVVLFALQQAAGWLDRRLFRDD